MFCFHERDLIRFFKGQSTLLDLHLINLQGVVNSCRNLFKTMRKRSKVQVNF